MANEWPYARKYYELAATDVCNKIEALADICRPPGSVQWMVTQRVKEAPSVAEKLKRKQERKPAYSIASMTDLVGVRCMVESATSARALETVIRRDNVFEVDDANSEDFLAQPRADGYRGIHLILRVPINLKAKAVVPVELQIRTILQHQWSVLSHAEFYKTIYEIPPALLGRMRALSEILQCAEVESEDLRRTRVLDETNTQLWNVLRTEVLEQLYAKGVDPAAVGRIANTFIEYDKQLRRTLISTGEDQRLAHRAFEQLGKTLIEMAPETSTVIGQIAKRVAAFVTPVE